MRSDWAKAKRRWSRTDPVLWAVAREHKPPEPAYGAGTPFAALVESITHQQVSLAAGRTIHGRVVAACGGRVVPKRVIELGFDDLRGAGLSRAKAAYVLDLAEHVRSGRLDFKRLAAADDAAVVAALTAVKGIGVWTAKMHLMFHLRRPDVLAHEDLGLQIAVARLYDVPREEAARVMRERAPDWSPYASLAALTLWHWRHVMDELEAAA